MARNRSGSAFQTSMLRMLVATLVSMALMAGPSRAAATVSDAADRATAFVICHASSGDADKPPSQAPGHPHDCQLCPMCHLAAQPAFASGVEALAPPSVIVVGAGAAARPAATGPPKVADAATPSTGPPASPV